MAIDARGRIVLCNPAARAVLGLGGESGVCGASLRSVLGAFPGLCAVLEDALGGGLRPSRQELTLPRAGAPPLVIGFTVSTSLGADGEIAGASVGFRDLAPVERVAEDERLRRRLEALGHTAAGLAHELRNPLAAVRVLSEVLARRASGDDPEVRALVDDIAREIGVAESVVSACLDFTRPWSPCWAPIDPGALLDQALERARARVAFRGRIERSYEAACEAVRGDARALERVCEHLIENAFEAMAPGAETDCLRLETFGRPRAPGAQEDGGEWVIRVSDTGPGIAAADRDRVFYPFYTSKDSGSGLGLSDVQKVATGHQGHVRLCEAERGACIEVCLPTSPAEPVLAAAAGAPA